MKKAVRSFFVLSLIAVVSFLSLVLIDALMGQVIVSFNGTQLSLISQLFKSWTYLFAFGDYGVISLGVRIAAFVIIGLIFIAIVIWIICLAVYKYSKGLKNLLFFFVLSCLLLIGAMTWPLLFGPQYGMNPTVEAGYDVTGTIQNMTMPISFLILASVLLLCLLLFALFSILECVKSDKVIIKEDIKSLDKENTNKDNQELEKTPLILSPSIEDIRKVIDEEIKDIDKEEVKEDKKETKKCLQCGFLVDIESKYCANCGYRFGDSLNNDAKEAPNKIEQEKPQSIIIEVKHVDNVIKGKEEVNLEEKEEESSKQIVRLSFEERLKQTPKEILDDYNELKSEILSWGVKSRVSNAGDIFRLHKKTYIKMIIAGKGVKLYMALDPKEYLDTTFPVLDAGHKGLYREIPLVFKVKSGLSMRRAKQLIRDCMEKDGLVQGEIIKKDWAKEIIAN